MRQRRPLLNCGRAALLAASLHGSVGAWAAEPPEAVPSSSQTRPSEDDLFGAAPAQPAAPAEPVQAPLEGSTPVDSSRDAQILGQAPKSMFSEEPAPSDPLTLGGRLYMRSQTSLLEEQTAKAASFGSPTLLDIYLDARPNERVRGFVLARVQYDPTTVPGGGGLVATTATTNGVSGSPDLAARRVTAAGPRLVLDQMWLRFDIEHTLFVTAGTQHVRWGTGRFWAPSDFLHLRRRNPLDVFDARTGTTLLKVHLPIESRAWNFYAYALPESPSPTGTLRQVAGAARAEMVLGAAELGLGAVLGGGRAPRYAGDLSFGIGEIDFYGEVALRDRGEIDRVYFEPNATVPPTVDLGTGNGNAPSSLSPADLAAVVDAFYPVYRNRGYRPQSVAGFTYSRTYHDSDAFTLGGEYFYNGLGYESPTRYPGLILPHSSPLNEPATFFYLGRHYGALFATFPAPYSLDRHNFTLSTLGNLSDFSFITRFDYALTLLTHLQVEAFAALHYGETTGEFRLGVRNLEFGGIRFDRGASLVDLGLGLRMAL
jgi:hypothetical protein